MSLEESWAEIVGDREGNEQKGGKNLDAPLGVETRRVSSMDKVLGAGSLYRGPTIKNPGAAPGNLLAT